MAADWWSSPTSNQSRKQLADHQHDVGALGLASATNFYATNRHWDFSQSVVVTLPPIWQNRPFGSHIGHRLAAAKSPHSKLSIPRSMLGSIL